MIGIEKGQTEKIHLAVAELLSHTEMEPFLTALVEQFARIWGADACCAALLDEEREAMVFRKCTENQQMLEGREARKGEGVVGCAWQQGIPVFISDYDKWGHSIKWMELSKLKSAAAWPLYGQERLLGVLVISFLRKREFLREETATAELFIALAERILSNVFRFSTIYQELMVRKWVEAAMQMTEGRYRTLLENLNVGVALIDRDRRLLSANHQLKRWYPTAEETLLPFTAAGQDESESVRETALESTFKDGQVHEEIISRSISGEIRQFRIVVSPVWGRSEMVSEVIEMVEDITEKRRAEEEIHKLSRAVDQSSSSVMITDLSGKIEYINDRFSQMTGYSPAEVMGKLPSVLKSGRTDSLVYRQMWQDIQSGKEWRGELLNKRADGTLYWALSSISPIRNTEGDIIHYMCTQEDLTRRKEMEEELRLKNEELEETLRKLGQTQVHLVQQEKLAAIGHLAAGVAHEINNPLGFVMSNFSTLHKYVKHFQNLLVEYQKLAGELSDNKVAALSPKIEEYLAEIKKQEQERKIQRVMGDLEEIFSDSQDGLERVSEIVKELRAFSRVDQPNVYDDYDLNAGVESALTMARNAVKYVANVEKELGAVARIQALGSAINQVLLNMLVNAGQAIQSKVDRNGMGTIQVKTYQEGDWVCLDIRDDGVGISPEDVNQIFNPFFTTKPVGQGVGLGLSISYDIVVNKHGGTIQVESVPGEGTCFTVKLPICHQDKEEPDDFRQNTLNTVKGGTNI